MSGGGNSQGSGDGFQSQGSECLDAIMAESPVGDAAPAPSMLPQPRPAPIPDLATPVLDGASPTAPSDHASSGANTSAAASASIEAAGVGGDGGGGGGVAVGPSSNKRKQREDPGESCSAAGCGGATASSSAAAAKKVPHRPRRRRVYTRKKRTQTSRDASPRTGKKAGRPGTACAFHSKKKDKCPQSRGKFCERSGMTAGDVEAEMSAQAAAPENEEAEADDLASWIVRNPAAVGAAALLLEAEAPMQAETDAARAGEPDFLGMVEEDAEEEALEDPWGQRLASLQPPAMEAIVEDEEAALVALILASVEAQASAAMEEEEGDLDMDFFL